MSPSATATGQTASVLAGVGGYLPPNVVSNAELSTRLDVDDNWIWSRTGIRSRHVADAGTTTADLAYEAGHMALASSGRQRVQAVVLATSTPDRVCPSMAPAVASRLGLGGVPAVDLSAGCTGFLYGLAAGAGFISSGVAEDVLVIGAERLSTLPHASDRTTVPLFGDGAGAVVIRRGGAGDAGAIGRIRLGSDGQNWELLQSQSGGDLHMEGKEVFRHAVERMCGVATIVLEDRGWTAAQVDRLVTHQANARISALVAGRLGTRDDAMVHNIASVGNTGAASLPLVLAQATHDGRIAPGSRVLLAAFGAGLTWGGTSVTWPNVRSAWHED